MTHNAIKTTKARPSRSRVAQSRSAPREGIFSLQEQIGNEAVTALIGRPVPEVRIHNDHAADARARGHHAAAFTEGPDIHFRQGVLGGDLGTTVLAHELAHVIQQIGPRSSQTLAPEQAEREVGRSGEVTAGGAARGSIQKWPWEEEKQRAQPNPEIERRLLEELTSSTDAWKRHLDDPVSAETLRTHGAIQRAYQDDKEFQKWLRDPAYRPPGVAQAPVQPWTPAMDAPRQTATARAAEDERAAQYTDAAGKRIQGPVTERPSEVLGMRVKRPSAPRPPPRPADWATEWNRMTPEQRMKGSYRDRTTPRERYQASLLPHPRWYYTQQMRELDEVPLLIELAPLGRAAWMTGTMISGETLSGIPIDRTEQAKAIAREVATQAVLAAVTEGLGELRLGGGLEPSPALPEAVTGELGELKHASGPLALEPPGAVTEGLGELPQELGAVTEGLGELPPEPARPFQLGPDQYPETGELAGGEPQPGSADPLEFEPHRHPEANQAPARKPAWLERTAHRFETRAERARRSYKVRRDKWAKDLGLAEGGDVHHAIELDVLDLFPGAFTEDELNVFENMRGIAPSDVSELHRSTIRRAWNYHYAELKGIVKGLEEGSPEYIERVRSYIFKARDTIDEATGGGVGRTLRSW